MPNIQQPQGLQQPSGGGFWNTLMQLASVIPGPQQPFAQAAMGINGALQGSPQQIAKLATQHGINGPMGSGGPSGTGGAGDNPAAGTSPTSGTDAPSSMPSQQGLMDQSQGQASTLAANPQAQLAQQAVVQGLQGQNPLAQGLQQAGTPGASPIYQQIMAHMPPKMDTATLAGMASLLGSGLFGGSSGGGGGFGGGSGGVASS